MSRTLVVRRLTAAIMVLAILGFALPATAAPGAHHSSRTSTVQAPSLLDQLLSWLGLFGPGQGSTHSRPDLRKSTTLTTPVSGGVAQQSGATMDMAYGMDPNGSH